MAVVEQHLVHFAEDGEQLAVLAHERHLAREVGDARAVEFLHLVDEPAVHEVERFFRIHLVRAFEVAEGHERLVFHQAEDAHLVHDGGVELILLLVVLDFGHGPGLEAFDGVVDDLRVFLLRGPLRPGGDEDSASVLVEEAALVGEVELADHVGEGEFLRETVTDLHAAGVESLVVRVDAEAGEEHLEHVLLADDVGGEECSIDEQRDVLGLVREHQVGVVVLLGDAVPEVPQRVLGAPGVAERLGGMALDAFRREFRALFLGNFVEREALEEFLPFFLQRSLRGHVVGGGQREGVDRVSVPGDHAYSLVRGLVALARDVEERAGGSERFFGIEFAEGRLLAASLQALHFHAGAVHEVHRFARLEGHFAQHRTASGIGVVEFVGGSVFAADDGPVAARELEVESGAADGAVGPAFGLACRGRRRSAVIVVIALRRRTFGRVGLGRGLDNRVAVAGTGHGKEQREHRGAQTGNIA